MTPKEKAKELMLKYLKLDIEVGGQYDGYLTMKMHDAKQCALIAVDEIIEQNNIWIKHTGKGTNNYWQEVKQEIAKL
jgi:hypothetical protein